VVKRAFFSDCIFVTLNVNDAYDDDDDDDDDYDDDDDDDGHEILSDRLINIISNWTLISRPYIHYAW